MSERRAFFCPECKSDAIGALVERTAIRCDHKVDGWRSIEVGRDKKGESLLEHIPRTTPGCGGVLRNCFHALKICGVCPPNFAKATEAIDAQTPLADIMKEENRLRAEREQAAKYAQKHGGPQASFAAPAGKIHLPHLGEAEPSRYKPSNSRGNRS